MFDSVSTNEHYQRSSKNKVSRLKCEEFFLIPTVFLHRLMALCCAELSSQLKNSWFLQKPKLDEKENEKCKERPV
jgi:hypothetical protein